MTPFNPSTDRQEDPPMSHNTRTDIDTVEQRESDCWPQCHCQACVEARREDPGSTFAVPGLSRDGGER